MNRDISNKSSYRLSSFVLNNLNGTRHLRSLVLYLVIVIGHFSEHLAQVAQVHLLGWQPRLAGGILGLWLPGLARAEVLHLSYNSLQLVGLILLWPGFRGKAKAWWTFALLFQSWHFLEHVVLQIQYLTGNYLFDASSQRSLLEFFFPRIELHLVYNLLVVIPTFVAITFRVLARGQNNAYSVKTQLNG